MHIAICDDDQDELSRISLLLDQFLRDQNAPITYKAFQSGVELLFTAKSSGYSLYFLDVIMPGLNGIEVAKEIRSFCSEAPIVFLTSSPEFAVASYTVKARDYLLKPVDEGRFFDVLNELIIDSQKPQEGLTVKAKTGITRILFSKLVYVEVVNKQVYFHLSDGSVREVTASLSEFEASLLARTEFMKVHRSYIVNLYQINELTSSGLTTHQGDSIPVSRTLYKEVRDAYVKHLFQ